MIDTLEYKMYQNIRGQLCSIEDKIWLGTYQDSYGDVEMFSEEDELIIRKIKELFYKRLYKKCVEAVRTNSSIDLKFLLNDLSSIQKLIKNE